MRVRVTGAAGFIGSHVLEAAGARPRGPGTGFPAPAVHNGIPPDIPGGTDLRVADVRDPAAVDSALDGVDAVCHLAAMVGLAFSG